MSSTEIEIVKNFFRDLNADNMTAALSFFDSQVVRVEFEGTPTGVICRGLEEMRAHFLKGRSTWAEGGCHPQKIVVEKDKVVVQVHVKVRLKDKTEWIDGYVGDVFTFRNGKIIEMRSFMKVADAFEWAGVKF